MSSGTIIEAASAGSGTGPVAGAVLADGEQVEVAEHPVEELGLLLRVPVQRVEVDLAALVHRVDEVVEVGHARVGEHGLQAVEPDVEDVLRATPDGEQRRRSSPAVGRCRRPRRPSSADPARRARCRRPPARPRSRTRPPSSSPVRPSVLGRRGQLLARRARPRRRPGCPGPAQRASRTARASSGAASASRASSASECSRTGGRGELSRHRLVLLGAMAVRRARGRAAPTGPAVDGTRGSPSRRASLDGSPPMPPGSSSPTGSVHLAETLTTALTRQEIDARRSPADICSPYFLRASLPAPGRGSHHPRPPSSRRSRTSPEGSRCRARVRALAALTVAAVCPRPPPSCSPRPPHADAVRIHDIQGTTRISPLAGQQVTDVPGIVTGVRTYGSSQGLLDPGPARRTPTRPPARASSSSPAPPPTVAVGDAVTVTGTVSRVLPGRRVGRQPVASPRSPSRRSPSSPAATRCPPPTVVDAGPVPAAYAPAGDAAAGGSINGLTLRARRRTPWTSTSPWRA